MKTKLNILIIFSMALMLVLASSCTRKAVEEPSPLGPSSYAIILKADASPNVIIASKTRDSTVITATLTNFQGIPLSNETIVFEIVDPTTGNVIHNNVGYFEGNKTVVTRATNSNGAVSVTYYGPISEELVDSVPPSEGTQDPIIAPPGQVYIRASISWQGTQFISDYAPIEIIVDLNQLELRLRANPNNLWIQGSPQKSTLIATLTTIEGAPVKGRQLFFSFLFGPGEFQNGKRTAFVTTDSSGEAKIKYVSPDRSHISTDGIQVKFRAQLETNDPNWAHAETSVWLYRGN